MSRLLSLLALALAVACVIAEPEVLSMPMRRDASRYASALYRNRLAKRDPFAVNLEGLVSDGGFYLVNVTVGTPPQNIQLDIDTGSSDVWMFGARSCEARGSVCIGGQFDPSSSKTLQAACDNPSECPEFVIQYGTPGSGVKGTYFLDTFRIGGQTVTNLTMAYATSAVNVDTGIMGIGFALGEAIEQEANITYPSLVETMANESLIPSASYSLYLDDLDAGQGTVLFGGYDTDKVDGNLAVLDIQPAEEGQYSRMLVIWSSIGVTDKSGSTAIPSSNVPQSALLDSGTSLTVLPPDIFNTLVTYFGAAYNQELEAYEVNCNLGYGTLDFGFGDASGPVIGVPFSELAIPVTDTNGNIVTNNGSPVCQLGLDVDSDGSGVIFGDTFLRSAYVVYDLTRKQIAIGQTKFNVTTSNVKAINAGNGNLIGASSVVASGTTLSYTATAAATDVVAPGVGAATSPASGIAFGSATSVTSASRTIVGGIKTTYSNLATNIPGATGPVSGTGTGTGTSTSTSTKTSSAISSHEAMDFNLQVFILVAMMFLGVGAMI